MSENPVKTKGSSGFKKVLIKGTRIKRASVDFRKGRCLSSDVSASP